MEAEMASFPGLTSVITTVLGTKYGLILNHLQPECERKGIGWLVIKHSSLQDCQDAQVSV